MMRIPPYDTGKVKIGEHYQRPIKYPMSRDAERLQAALLRVPQRYIDADREQLIAVLKDSLMWTAFTVIMAAMMLSPTIYRFLFTQGA